MGKRISELESSERQLQKKYDASKAMIAKYEQKRRESMVPQQPPKAAAKRKASVEDRSDEERQDDNKFVFKPPSHTPGRSKPGQLKLFWAIRLISCYLIILYLTLVGRTQSDKQLANRQRPPAGTGTLFHMDDEDGEQVRLL